MKKQNNNGLDLTQRRHATRCLVSSDLLAKAKTNDADALFSIGIQTLQQNSVGAAERGFMFAARAGHPRAKRAHDLLRSCDSVSKWRDTVLYRFNNSIL